MDSTPIGEFDANRPSQKAAGQREPFKAPGIAVLAVDDTPMNLKVVTKLLRGTEIAVERDMVAEPRPEHHACQTRPVPRTRRRYVG